MKFVTSIAHCIVALRIMVTISSQILQTLMILTLILTFVMVLSPLRNVIKHYLPCRMGNVLVLMGCLLISISIFGLLLDSML